METPIILGGMKTARIRNRVVYLLRRGGVNVSAGVWVRLIFRQHTVSFIKSKEKSLRFWWFSGIKTKQMAPRVM